MPMDIPALLKQLTLQEKAALCIGLTAWDTVPVERLGIPSLVMSDGPHGVRRVPGMHNPESLPATCFPTASALAATWDRDLIDELGTALAEECIALGVDVLLGPGNNMKRTPLCGRNFEYFSEDPYLGGEMAAQYINAVQRHGVGTSLKHFVANNQETNRMSVSAEVGERALREVYLAGFERAVKRAQPWTVMCAYNRLNGVHCSENPLLLRDILRDEWGFEGLVVSDWGAVHDRVAALAGGLDLEMPGPQAPRVQSVVDAVESGALALAVLDEAVERVLRLVFKAKQTRKGHTEIDVDAHHALARRIAGEAIVLLKNDGDLLPLQGVSRLAVIGQGAQQAHFQGIGSSHINPTRVDNPFEELSKMAGPEATLTYAPGYTFEDTLDQTLIDEAVALAEQAEVALVYIALPPFKEAEGEDRPDIDLSDQQIALIKAVAAAQPRCVVILNNGSAVAMQDWIGDVPAVLEAWLMGQAGGGAIADVLFGKVNPSGRLAESFPLKLSHTPAYTNFPGENGLVHYGEGPFIGYRYYDAKDLPVLFPFGYGLSYTTFDYANLRLAADHIQATDALTLALDVTNTGSVAGKTTVQVYVQPRNPVVSRPVKTLQAFAKVALAPGATQTVTLTLEPGAFACYDPAQQTWVTDSGTYDILVGESAAAIHQQAPVEVDSAQGHVHRLYRFSTLGEWLADPVGVKVLEPLLNLMAEAADSDQVAQLTPDRLAWMQDVPLDAALAFWEDNPLTVTPEAYVEEMLAQVAARQ